MLSNNIKNQYKINIYMDIIMLGLYLNLSILINDHLEKNTVEIYVNFNDVTLNKNIQLEEMET